MLSLSMEMPPLGHVGLPAVGTGLLRNGDSNRIRRRSRRNDHGWDHASTTHPGRPQRSPARPAGAVGRPAALRRPLLRLRLRAGRHLGLHHRPAATQHRPRRRRRPRRADPAGQRPPRRRDARRLAGRARRRLVRRGRVPRHAVGRTGHRRPARHRQGQVVAEQLSGFIGLGVVIVFLAAFALGRFAVVGARERAWADEPGPVRLHHPADRARPVRAGEPARSGPPTRPGDQHVAGEPRYDR